MRVFYENQAGEGATRPAMSVGRVLLESPVVYYYMAKKAALVAPLH